MRRLTSALTIAIITVLLLEAALRLYDPAGLRLQGDRILLPTGAHYTITNPDSPKLDRIVEEDRNALGFRGPNVPADFASRLSIVTVGGSTTECLPQPDEKTWPAVMSSIIERQRPDVWVNNAGLSGHSTVGHLVLLDSYLKELHPRVVVYLVGANELGYTPAVQVFGWRARLASYSAVANLLWNIERVLLAKRMGFDGIMLDPQAAGHRSMSEAEIAKYLADDAPYVEGYRARLVRLIERTRAEGIEPILVTQPMLGGDLVDPATGVSLATILEQPGELNGLASWRQLERYNDVTRQLAAAYQLGLVDLAMALPKDSRLFLDFTHFSNAGAAAVGEIVGAALAARFAATGGV